MTGARVLLIGISDGSGEVNSPSVERDLKVLSAHGCDAKVIITAIKHTNDETEPGEYFPIPTKFVENQIDAALKNSEIEAVKISTYYIHGLENTILSISRARPGLITVVDASRPLLRDEEALKSLNSETTVTVQDQFVVQPGGVSSPYSSQSPVAASSLATAIAANLANRKQVPIAVREAIDYIQNCEKVNEPGAELNYFHSTYKLPFGPGQFVPYLLQRPDVQEAWKRHTEHEFLARLADGTLPLEAFKYYLIQDYLFLIQFARANALAAYKEKDLDKIVRSAEIILHINREMALHLSYCKDFGLEKENILKVPESQACTAYTRYVLDTGNSEDWFALQIALSPCLIGYGVIARRLYDDPKTVREGNRYWKWIENYVADDYVEAVVLGTELLEKHAQKQSPSRIEELVKIFIHATNMETGFWDMGYGMK